MSQCLKIEFIDYFTSYSFICYTNAWTILGDNWSGMMIVVATDYKRFSIIWGCTKWSQLDQRCDDPWLYVKTRQLKVFPDLLASIDSILQSVFGLSLNELNKIRHGSRKCLLLS